MPRPASLSLALPKNTSTVSSTVTSPTDGGSASSSPVSTGAPSVPPEGPVRHHKASKSDITGLSESHSTPIQPSSPEITSLPPFPSSPKDIPKHAKDSAKTFFMNMKASKSSNKVHQGESTIRQVSEDTPRSQIDSQQSSIYSLRKSPGSTPDLSLSNYDVSSADDREGKRKFLLRYHYCRRADRARGREIQRKEVPRRPLASSRGSDSMNAPSPTEPSYPRKPKPRFGNLISRTRSIRLDDGGGRRSKPLTPITASAPGRRMHYDGVSENDEPRAAPRTAPLNPDRSLREMMASGGRNHSADRQAPNHSSENVAPRRVGPPNTNLNPNSALSSSTAGVIREGAGSHLFANIKHTSTKAADGLGRAGKGIFGKINRSGSSTVEKDERYVLRVINLPLVEQTRRTRIAARLEDSKDKTEFWMPALPWRCIE